MKQRNGKIEFMRFIFCMAVIMFHIGKKYFGLDYQVNRFLSCFRHGDLGVEFFFLVSGYLFAAACFKKRGQEEPLGKSTLLYIYHKWISFYPQYLIAFFATYAALVCIGKMNLLQAVKRLLDGLPSLFLLQRTGIYGESVIGEAWYLGAMLFALFVLYPLCRKNYDLFTRVFAPAAGICILGYLYKTYGRISDGSGWDVWFSRAQLRAVAEICLGAFLFEARRFLDHYQLPQSWRFSLTILECGCYLSVLLYMCSTAGEKYELFALYALMAAVCLSFSRQTFGQQFFQNQFVFFLGKLSLPLYLSQNFVRSLVMNYGGGIDVRIQIVMILIGDFLAALLLLRAGNALGDRMKMTLASIPVYGQEQCR